MEHVDLQVSENGKIEGLGFLWARDNTTSLKRCRKCSAYCSTGVEAEEIKRLITSVNGLKRLSTQYS